jgi:hypothetical protein
MLTHTLLSYKLSRRTLLLAYAAIIPLLAFALRELFMYEPHRGGWQYLGRGILVVTALLAAVHLYRKWTRFVTEMYCTEVGIHVNTVLCGNLDISWGRVLKLKPSSGMYGRDFVTLEIADEPPVHMYMDKATRDKLVALVTKSSTATVEALE